MGSFAAIVYLGLALHQEAPRNELKGAFFAYRFGALHVRDIVLENKDKFTTLRIKVSTTVSKVAWRTGLLAQGLQPAKGSTDFRRQLGAASLLVSVGDLRPGATNLEVTVTYAVPRIWAKDRVWNFTDEFRDTELFSLAPNFGPLFVFQCESAEVFLEKARTLEKFRTFNSGQSLGFFSPEGSIALSAFEASKFPDETGLFPTRPVATLTFGTDPDSLPLH